MKPLNQLTSQELKKFFNSFDQVLIDIEGVLWNTFENIPGTDKAIDSLKDLNKQIIFIANTSDGLKKKFKKFGFDENKVVTPTHVMIWFLNKQKFDKNKKIFVIGMQPLKEALINEGYALAENGPDQVGSTEEFLEQAYKEDESIGAVIVDTDFNVNYLNMLMAANYLKTNPEVLFLAGAKDVKVPVKNGFMLGPGNFVKTLEDSCGRKCIPMAKPSNFMNNYIAEKFKLQDFSRVLFVGDSISDDMAFAAKFGCKKLLVFTGVTKKEMLEKCIFSEEDKPDFYLESFADIYNLSY